MAAVTAGGTQAVRAGQVACTLGAYGTSVAAGAAVGACAGDIAGVVAARTAVTAGTGISATAAEAPFKEMASGDAASASVTTVTTRASVSWRRARHAGTTIAGVTAGAT